MKLKKLMSYILLVICIPIFCLPLCGFTANGQVNIKHNGKGDATFFVESTLEEDAFKKKMETVVQDFNVASGSNDMVNLKDVEMKDGLYEVSVSFRRIDKVHPRGNFYLYKAETLKAKQSEELDQLQRWERGDINCKSYVFYNQLRGLVQIKKPRENGPTVMVKPNSAAGELLSVKNFTESVSEKNDVLVFQLLDTLGIQKVQVSLPGTITYYSSGIKVINESTFEMTPITVEAEVTRNDVESLEPIVTTENIQVFVGYVAFQKSISPFAIIMIVIASAAAVGLLVFILAYFYQRGKRLQEKEDEAKEIENGRKSNQE